MKKEPYISIVLICYNYGHLLPRALNKIASQTFRDFELVFVDNGCTDNSVEVLHDFMDMHPEIDVKLVTVEKNIGLAHGDNVGSAAATGTYLLFHDADDWMDDNTLELLANAAKSNDADRVIASFRDVDQNGKVLQEQCIEKKNPVYWMYGMQQANLFRRSIYQGKGIQVHDNLWIDSEKTLRFSQFVRRVAYVKEPCYNYLVHLDSTSRSKEIYQLIGTERYSIENLLRSCEEVYSNEADQGKKQWIELQIAKIYYSYIYQFLREAPMKEKIRKYKEIHSVMRKYFPQYLQNPKTYMHNALLGGGIVCMLE